MHNDGKAGMSVAAGCSGPDSRRVTVQLKFSDSLPATTGPENVQIIMHFNGFFDFVYDFSSSDS